MNDKKPNQPGSSSLSRRELQTKIDSVELQIRTRRLAIDRRADRLRDEVIDRLTSPLALLSAAGFGYVIGEITRGHKTAGPITTVKESNYKRLIVRPIQFLTLTYSVLQTWPVNLMVENADKLDPSSQDRSWAPSSALDP